MFGKSRVATLGAVAAVALSFSLSACQNANEPSEAPIESVSPSTTDSPSPSVSPTPEDPAKAAEAENVAEAKDRYLEFQEITTAQAKKGKSPFSKLMSGGYIGSPELQSQQQSFWEQYTDLELKQTGEAKARVVKVTKYEGDPLQDDVTGHRVHLRVCIDNSDKEVVNPDGTSALRSDSPEKALMEIVMQGQKQDGIWSVNEVTSIGEDC